MKEVFVGHDNGRVFGIKCVLPTDTHGEFSGQRGLEWVAWGNQEYNFG